MCGDGVGVWELGSVALAVGGGGNGFERDDEGGSGGGGQESGDVVGEGCGIAIGCGIGDDAAGVLWTVQDGDGVAHAGLGAQRGFDLAEFDAVAAQLHLLVEAAEELKRPVESDAGTRSPVR